MDDHPFERMERHNSIEQEHVKIDQFFSLLIKPSNLESIRQEVTMFLDEHKDKRIVLITVSSISSVVISYQ